MLHQCGYGIGPSTTYHASQILWFISNNFSIVASFGLAAVLQKKDTGYEFGSGVEGACMLSSTYTPRMGVIRKGSGGIS